MKKFEYKVLRDLADIKSTHAKSNGTRLSENEFETVLNILGSDGWEFAQSVNEYYVFKREIVAKTTGRTRYLRTKTLKDCTKRQAEVEELRRLLNTSAAKLFLYQRTGRYPKDS